MMVNVVVDVYRSNPLPRESSDGELKGRRREGLARQGSQEVRLMTFAVCIG